MMKCNFLSVLLLASSFLCSIACTNGDEGTIYEKNSLNGPWHLSSYGGGFAGHFEKYDTWDVTWNFDTINKTVSVESYQIYFGPKTGIFTYEIRKADQDDTVLFLNDSVQGILGINDNELTFNHGLVATFKR